MNNQAGAVILDPSFFAAPAVPGATQSGRSAGATAGRQATTQAMEFAYP